MAPSGDVLHNSFCFCCRRLMLLSQCSQRMMQAGPHQSPLCPGATEAITCPSCPQPAAVWQRRAARCGPFWGCLYCCHLRGRPWKRGRSQVASCVAANASCARWSKGYHCDSDSQLQQQHLLLSTESEIDRHGDKRVDHNVK